MQVENRHGLIVTAELPEANGGAERSVGGDKGYDTAEFVRECRHMNRGTEPGPAGRQCHRRTHHAARRLRRQSEETETDRGVLRLAEG
jgi:hypothetical protein